MDVHQVHWSSKPTSFYKNLAHANRANVRATRKKQAATRLTNAGEEVKRAAKDLKLASAELEAVRSRLVRCIAAGNEAGAAEAAAPEPALKAKVHALRQRAATAKGKYQTLKAAAQGAVPPQATGPCTHDTMAASAAAARAPKPAPPAMVDSRIANREALEINPELRHLKSKVVAWAKSFTAAENARQETEVAAQKAQHLADSWCKALPPPEDPDEDAKRAAARARHLQQRLRAANRARQQKQLEQEEQAVTTASRVAAAVEQQQRVVAAAAGAYVPGSYYQLCSAPASAVFLDDEGDENGSGLTLAAATREQRGGGDEAKEPKATIPASPDVGFAAETAAQGAGGTRLSPAETPTTPQQPTSPASEAGASSTNTSTPVLAAATIAEPSSALDAASDKSTTATKENIAPSKLTTDAAKMPTAPLPVVKNAALRLATTSRLSQAGPHARRAWLPSGFRCEGVNCAPVSDAGGTASWSDGCDESEGKRGGDTASGEEKEAAGTRRRVPSSAVVRYFSLPPPLLSLNHDAGAPPHHSTWHRRQDPGALGTSATKNAGANTTMTATSLARSASTAGFGSSGLAATSRQGSKIKATKNTVGGLVRSLAEDLFVAGDRNGDGVLNPEELRNAFTVLGTGPDGRATKIFRRLGVRDLAATQAVLNAEALFEGLGYGRGHTGSDDAPRTTTAASTSSRSSDSGSGAVEPSPSWEHGPFVTEPECAAYLAFAAHSLRREAQETKAAAATKAGSTASVTSAVGTAAVITSAVKTTRATSATSKAAAPSQEVHDINNIDYRGGGGGGVVVGDDISFAAPTPPRRGAPSVPKPSVTSATKPKSVGFAELPPKPPSTPQVQDSEDAPVPNDHGVIPPTMEPLPPPELPVESVQARSASAAVALSPDLPASSSTQRRDFYANEVAL